MKTFLFAVRDSAAEAFGTPFFLNSKGVAVRSFTSECNRVAPDNLLNRHPADFKLYCLGTFDDSTGRFDLLDDPECIAFGSQAVAVPQDSDSSLSA